MSKYTIEIDDASSEKLIVGIAKRLGADVKKHQESKLFQAIMASLKEIAAGGKFLKNEEIVKYVRSQSA